MEQVFVEQRKNSHKFIHYFEPRGYVCSRFPVLSWANGCVFDCEYCFLKYTLRWQKSKVVVWPDYEKMAKAVAKWASQEPDKPEYLNAGELADGLALPYHAQGMIDTVLGNINGSKGLYILTKSDAMQLRQVPSSPKVVVAFSVNAAPVSAVYEHGAPSPKERLAAALSLREKGWRVRIRLDPMVPVPGWQQAYSDIVDAINTVQPERVTLGSLRFYRRLPEFAPSNIWRYGSEEEFGGKKRVARSIASEMYRFAVDRLKVSEVALCKESPDMWKALGLSFKPLKCSCLP